MKYLGMRTFKDIMFNLDKKDKIVNFSNRSTTKILVDGIFIYN